MPLAGFPGEALRERYNKRIPCLFASSARQLRAGALQTTTYAEERYIHHAIAQASQRQLGAHQRSYPAWTGATRVKKM